MALKRIDCYSQIDINRVRNEIDAHLRFGAHPNILELECFADDEIPQGLRFSLIFTYYEVQTFALLVVRANFHAESDQLPLFKFCCCKWPFFLSLL